MAQRFGASWWGRAWIDAVENRASLDPNRLPRGRTYARHGHVLSVETAPGSIRAVVRGSRRQPYQVDIRFRSFTDDEWDRLLDLIVVRAERAAALLDGELHPGLVEEAAQAGIDLLPHAGELQPRCSCPDRADPCKHSAAVCYLVSDELDNDPFVLLKLRGRDRDEVLAGVRQRRAGQSDRSSSGVGMLAEGFADTQSVDPGIRADEGWARPLGPLPSVPSPRLHSGGPPVPTFAPPREAPFTPDGLNVLVSDAATRAWLSLTGEPTLQLGLAPKHDLVRRAAEALGTEQLLRLAQSSGTSPRALTRRAIAWRVGGVGALAASEEPPWRVEPWTMAAARQSLTESGVASADINIDRNRITFGERQLRLSRRRLWWRFIKRGGAWELDGGPTSEADELLDP